MINLSIQQLHDCADDIIFAGIPRYKVDTNGNLTVNDFNFTNSNAFENAYIIKNFSYAFYGTSVSGTVSFPYLRKIKADGMVSSFYNTSISGISFPELKEIEASGLENTFARCGSLSGDITFPKLETIGSLGLDNTFNGCSSITRVFFPKLVNIDREAFGDSDSASVHEGTFYNDRTFEESSLSEIHFRADAETAVKSTYGYSNNFGASGATIYFDLGLVYVNIIPNVSGATIYYKNEICTNPLNMFSGLENSYYVYKTGYCVYIGSKTLSSTDEGNTINENITMTTSGDSITLNITLPTHSKYNTTDVTVYYMINGNICCTDTFSNVQTNSTITSSKKFPANTEITYKVKATGYTPVINTATPANNTVNITLDPNVYILDTSYPFTSDAGYLTHLIDDVNFTINDDTKTPASCIASTGNQNLCVGYIEFTTPNTTDPDLLTISVTAAEGGGYAFSYGVIYYNTTGTLPSSVDWSGLSDNEGRTNSYGTILLGKGYSATVNVFRTVSATLSPNTKYYLCFYYGINSHSPWDGWEKLAVSDIRIPMQI